MLSEAGTDAVPSSSRERTCEAGRGWPIGSSEDKLPATLII